MRWRLCCGAVEACGAAVSRVLQAPAPALPEERGRPGSGLLAHVQVSKYCDGLPPKQRHAVRLARSKLLLAVRVRPAG